MNAKTTQPQYTTQFSIKAILLSIILIVIFTASNTFLGLKLGTTISASIPAVVIAMGFFRLFKNHNVYEINMVQTAAATGEGATAGTAYTLPALIIMNYWAGFNYWETVTFCVIGGILGVLISVPLSKALLADKTLPFPEGIAIGHVMQASTNTDSEIKPIVHGGIIGAIVALCQNGFQILAQNYEYWIIKGKMILGYSLGFSPAVIAAGYICGITVGVGMLVGVILGWILGIPILSFHYEFAVHAVSATTASNQIWAGYIRYIGVGTMLMGGIWTLIILIKPVIKAIYTSSAMLKIIRSGEGHTIHRTKRDIPINLILWGMVCIAAALLVTLFIYISPKDLGITWHLDILTIIVCVIFFFLTSFILSAIAGYFAGLVGVTNSPVSGLLVSALLALSFILLLIIGMQVKFVDHPAFAVAGASLAIVICTFVGASIALTIESIQVAKAGAMIKVTPWIQQITLIGGTIIAALTLPLVLRLLFNAYGIGGVFPHPGMSQSQMLSAPQAGLMAAIAQGVFAHKIPWPMITVGIMIAVICISIDEFLKRKFNKRLLVLAVGLGIYLPIDVTTPMILGGVIYYLAHHKLYNSSVPTTLKQLQNKKGLHHATFLACGLVAGSTLTGVVLAIPFAIFKSTEVLRIMPKNFTTASIILSIIITIALCYWIYRTATKNSKNS